VSISFIANNSLVAYPDHVSEQLQIEVIHPDDFVMDLVDLNEKRAVAAFRELRERKKSAHRRG
jgi:hypothetical protein